MGSVGKQSGETGTGAGITITVTGEEAPKERLSNEEKFIQDMINDITSNIPVDINGNISPEDLISNSDLQAMVEAFTMQYGGNDDEILNKIRDGVDQKLLSALDKPSAGLTTHRANKIETGDVITTKTFDSISDKNGKQQSWTFKFDNGVTTKDIPWGTDITVTDVKVTGKTVKVTGKTSKGNVVTKTFKPQDIIQKRK